MAGRMPNASRYNAYALRERNKSASCYNGGKERNALALQRAVSPTREELLEKFNSHTTVLFVER